MVPLEAENFQVAHIVRFGVCAIGNGRAGLREVRKLGVPQLR
jgi:hypothetical protein